MRFMFQTDGPWNEKVKHRMKVSVLIMVREARRVRSGRRCLIWDPPFKPNRQWTIKSWHVYSLKSATRDAAARRATRRSKRRPLVIHREYADSAGSNNNDNRLRASESGSIRLTCHLHALRWHPSWTAIGTSMKLGSNRLLAPFKRVHGEKETWHGWPVWRWCKQALMDEGLPSIHHLSILKGLNLLQTQSCHRALIPPVLSLKSLISPSFRGPCCCCSNWHTLFCGREKEMTASRG